MHFRVMNPFDTNLIICIPKVGIDVAHFTKVLQSSKTHKLINFKPL